jgi:hypothetical protein
MREITEQPLGQDIEKLQCIAVDCKAEFGGEGSHRIVGLNAFQIGPCTDRVMLVIDRQQRRFGHQDEIERIAAQGLYLHGHLDIKTVCFPLEPDLGYPISLKIEVFIPSQRRRKDAELMADDSLSSIIAWMKT